MPLFRRPRRPRPLARSSSGPSFLIPVILVLLAGSAVLFTVAASAFSDPFAPPGTVRIRVDVPERSVADRLRALGLQPEEAGGRNEHPWIEYRVPAERLAELEALGFSLRVMDDAAEAAGGGDEPAALTTYDQMAADLAQLAADHPALTTLASWGQSVQGREIWSLQVTRSAGVEENEPEFRVLAAHHGNERMSAEIAINLAHELLEKYGVDSTVTALVDSREIWIVPMVNPDGVVAGSRYNAHGVDLNRNYGYMWNGGGSSAWSEPETRAMRELATEHDFAVGLSFHTSGDVVNSTWNYSPIYGEDDGVIWALTQGYAAFNGYWAVRGWYWYETHGDCNDWSYGARAILDWTIEVSNFDEATVWAKNRDAILYMMDAAGRGIHGVVTDAATGAPLRARVYVEGNGWPAFTDPALGDFHKPILGGSYTLHVRANGYQEAVIPGVLVPIGGSATVNVPLSRGGYHYAAQVEEANVADPGDLYNNLTLTMSVLGAPDDVGCSLGRGGHVVVSFGPGSEPINYEPFGPSASVLPDFQVIESDEDGLVEGYSVYAGPGYNGPWTFIGNGTGSMGFDLDPTGISHAYYVKIVDDGDGSASDPNAGFDLDAIWSTSATYTSVPLAGMGGAGTPALRLAAPSPNPLVAGETGRIRFRAPAGAEARLELFDVAGRRVARLAEHATEGELVEVTWPGTSSNGSVLPAGVYFLRLVAGDEAASRKLVVVPASR